VAGQQVPSVVDVFENYLDASISNINATAIKGLSTTQVDELFSQLERFLEMALLTKGFSVETALVDHTADPYLALGAGQPPNLSRAVRQLALYYPRLVIPWDMTFRMPGKENAERNKVLLGYVADYIADIAPLLRKQVILPVDRMAYLKSQDMLPFDLATAHVNDALVAKSWEYIPARDDSAPAEKREIVSAYLANLYEDLLTSSQMSASPAVIDLTMHHLFLAHLEKDRRTASPLRISDREIAHKLVSLDLPGLDDISLGDLISIRESDDDFEEWRRALARTLHNVDAAVERGTSLNDAFADQLGEIEERAARLNSELKGKSLRGSIKSSVISTTIGGIAVYGGAEISQLMHHSFDAFSKLVTLGPLPLLNVIFWLLFNRCDPKKKRLARFYNALIDRRPND